MTASDDLRTGQLRDEFNRWAAEGRGEEMEDHHLPIVLPVLDLMRIAPSDRILDLGCGNGWLCRRLARLVPEGKVTGVDLSEEMIRHAWAASAGYANLNFLGGASDTIPCEDGEFNRIISVESAYYWPQPAGGIREMFRVLAPGGSAWVLINYFRENPYSHQWGRVAKVEMHLLSAEEWDALFRRAGFADVAHRLISDPTPPPETYSGQWFRDADELRKFRDIGALLVHGIKM